MVKKECLKKIERERQDHPHLECLESRDIGVEGGGVDGTEGVSVGCKFLYYLWVDGARYILKIHMVALVVCFFVFFFKLTVTYVSFEIFRQMSNPSPLAVREYRSFYIVLHERCKRAAYTERKCV